MRATDHRRIQERGGGRRGCAAEAALLLAVLSCDGPQTLGILPGPAGPGQGGAGGSASGTGAGQALDDGAGGQGGALSGPAGACTEESQFSILVHEYDPAAPGEGFGPAGCSSDPGDPVGLSIASQRLGNLLRVYVRRADGAALDPGVQLTLYVGSAVEGDSQCQADVANVPKEVQHGVLDAKTHYLDLSICPYDPCWCEGLEKIFWVAESVPGYESLRASSAIPLVRNCIPETGACPEVGTCPPEFPCP
ncbi:hypothetical protein BE20_35260 [Sorangium cellulosum]|uniref:Uncharacterized protein n=1 Tax=Sorangium cellulosum TaxID=56 RepID=A0A150RYJ0_SORCE|nr:hypothetical protein BE18_45180 [Sorangium cellulosum]KYF98388.1 hypothetical protein BE20_35260 [Sorangium cellulosum]